jgi:exo-beta-1,3-glucanase (GH17 family)
MMLRAATLAAFASAAAFAASAVLAAVPAGCPRGAAVAPALARLREILAHGRFVAYQPTALSVVNGVVTSADPASLRADLAILRERFDALITYDAVHGAQQIPAIAASLGFRALIIGVWNPLDDAELTAASDAVHAFPRLIVGVSLGNELLFSHRSDARSLAALIARVRARLPDTPLSTAEPFHLYYEPATAPLLARLDFLLVNVHPIFQPWFREAPDAAAAQFVVNVVAKLAAGTCGPILVKETGVPTAPASAGYTESRQASFYAELRRAFPVSAARAFAYFAAFDAPWRAYDATGVPGVHPEEAHWGLYDAERRPKPAARELPPL